MPCHQIHSSANQPQANPHHPWFKHSLVQMSEASMNMFACPESKHAFWYRLRSYDALLDCGSGVKARTGINGWKVTVK